MRVGKKIPFSQTSSKIEILKLNSNNSLKIEMENVKQIVNITSSINFRF